MRPLPLLLATLPVLVGAPLAGQEVGPFELTPDMRSWITQTTRLASSQKGALQVLLEATFRSQEAGGLGMVYDNTRTRTVIEVWQERKANCISLTAFFVAAARHLGIKCQFAEPLNTNRWHRAASVIRLERHIVALAPQPALGDLVADFLPGLRKRYGAYVVKPLSDEQALALFHANRAVELLDGGDPASAQVAAESALETDPLSVISWNTLGVILMHSGQEAKAEEALQKACLLDPRDGTPVGNLEVLMRQMNRPDDAARYRELGIALRQKDPYFNAFLAEESLTEGRPADALDRIDKAIALMPYDPEFHLTRARACLAMEKPEEARKALKVAQRWAIPAERARYDTKLEALAKL